MKLKGVLIACLAIIGFMASVGLSQEKASVDKQINAYIEMMRKDIRAQRNTVVDQAMDLEPAGKAKFWGIYDKYASEGKALWDQRLANITKYADNYDKITDTLADELATKSMDIQSQRLAIRKKYYGQMKAALGARVAVRFLQIETLLDEVLDLQIGSEIPLMK